MAKKVKVRLLVGIGGDFYGNESPGAGTVVEVDEAVAKAIAKDESPIAELVEKDEKPETARKASAPEAATRPRAEAR